RNAFWKYYPDILDVDIPFAQDCMGDQFLFRGNRIIKLYTETGQIESYNYDFAQFLEAIEKDPVNFLGMYPLIQLEMDEKSLEPGQLLQAFPPLSLQSSAMDLTIKPVPIFEQLQYLRDFYRKNKREENEPGDDVQFYVQ